MTFFKKHFFHILNILAILFGFIFITSYLQGDVCTDHDHWYIYNAGIIAGRIPALYLCKMFYKIFPAIFNIHQNDISAYIIPIFDAFAITVSAIFMLKIYYLFSKEQSFILNRKSFFILYPLCFIIAAIIPLISDNIDCFYFSGIASTLRYYDHVFNFIFFIIFIYFIIKILFVPINNSKRFKRLRKRVSIISDIEEIENTNLYENTFSNKYSINAFFLFLYCINAFILGMSTEMLIIISNIIGFIILCFFIYKIKKDVNSYYKVNIIYLFFIELSLLIGSAIDFLSSTYSEGQLGGYADYNAIQNIINLKSQIIPFCQSYLQFIINENIISLLIIIILNVAIHFIIKDKENNIKMNIFQGILIGSCLFFFLSLFFLGDSSLIYPIDYWVEYWPFRMLWGKILVLDILLISGYTLYNSIENKKICYSLFTCLIIFLSYYIGIYFNEVVEEYNFQVNESKILRPLLYKSDKMAFLYSQMDGIALLPITNYNKYGQHTSLYRPKCYDCREDIRNLMIKLTEQEVAAQKSRIFTVNKEINEPENEYSNYLKNTYKINLDGIIFIDDKKAEKEFIRRGGSFSDFNNKLILFSDIKKEAKNPINLKTLDEKIKENPDNEFLYAAKGRIYLKNKDYDRAIEKFKTAINKSDTVNPYYLLLANAYLEKGDINNAIENYKKIIEYYPYSLNIMAKTAQLYMEINDYSNAVKIYEKIINIFPYIPINEFKTYYNYIAMAECKLKNYNKAITYLNIAEKINPNDVDYLLRAYIEVKLNNIYKAQNDLDKAKQYNKNGFYDEIKFKKIQEICVNEQDYS